MRKTYLTCISVFSIVFATAQTTKNNGNTNVPVFKTEAEKATWIKNNPEEYKKISGHQENFTLNNKDSRFKSREEKQAWVDSQNKEKIAKKESSLKGIDNEKDKDEWIKNNRLAYEGSVEKSSKIVMSREEFNSLPSHKKEAVLKDKNFQINN